MNATEAIAVLTGHETTIDDERGVIVATYPKAMFGDLTEWMKAIEKDRDDWRKKANLAYNELEDLRAAFFRYNGAKDDAKAYHDREMDAYERMTVASRELERRFKEDAVFREIGNA